MKQVMKIFIGVFIFVIGILFIISSGVPPVRPKNYINVDIQC